MKQLLFILLAADTFTAIANAAKVFVVSGSITTNPAPIPVPFVSSTELVDLQEGGTTLPAANFPIAFAGGFGTFINNKPMFCGGKNDANGSPAVVNPKTCYTYDSLTNAWTGTFSMNTNRKRAAAVQLSPFQWWVTGGFDDIKNVPIISTEIFNAGSGFVYSVNLPYAMYSHSLVQINSTSIMMFGGISSGSGLFTSQVWLFSIASKRFTALPNLLTPIYTAPTGLVTFPDGRVAVVAASGYTTSSTQMFFLNNNTWTYGPTLPIGQLYFAAGVQYGNTFLVIGGRTFGTLADGGNVPQNTIYKFDPSTMSWVLLPQKLSVPRFDMLAVLVPDTTRSSGLKHSYPDYDQR